MGAVRDRGGVPAEVKGGTRPVVAVTAGCQHRDPAGPQNGRVGEQTELEDVLGLGAPQPVPSRGRHTTLKVIVAVASVVVVVGGVLAAIVGGGLLAWDGLAIAARGACPAPPTAPPGVMASADKLAASIDAMPGVDSTKSTVSTESPGVCANPQAYDQEPWNTSLAVTMTAGATQAQFAAVRQKVSGLSGSSIMLLAANGVANLTFTLPADPSTPVPIADARRVGAIPGVRSVHTHPQLVPANTVMLVDVDQLDSVPRVAAALQADDGPGVNLSISEGDRFNASFTVGSPTAVVLAALTTIAAQHPDAKFDLVTTTLDVSTPTRQEALAVADALDAVDTGATSGTASLGYSAAYNAPALTTARTGVVGGARRGSGL